MQVRVQSRATTPPCAVKMLGSTHHDHGWMATLLTLQAVTTTHPSIPLPLYDPSLPPPPGRRLDPALQTNIARTVETTKKKINL